MIFLITVQPFTLKSNENNKAHLSNFRLQVGGGIDFGRQGYYHMGGGEEQHQQEVQLEGIETPSNLPIKGEEGEEQGNKDDNDGREDNAMVDALDTVEEVSEGGELGEGSMLEPTMGAKVALSDPSAAEVGKDSTVRKTIRARQTAIQNPMMMDAMRRTRLGLKSGEVTGKLTFVVPKSRVLYLPPTPDDNSEISRKMSVARETLCRRFEALHPSRKEDDASYFDAVERGTEVTLITALPAGYEKGGWRCHAKTNSTAASGQVVQECLHVNRAVDECCVECQCPKPNIRPEFAYLRLLPPGMRRQRKEYERIIKQCDDELIRVDAAEREASERVAVFEKRSDELDQEVDNTGSNTSNPGTSAENDNESSEFNDDEDLMMDVDLVQKGTWQRVNAKALLPMLASRKIALHNRLSIARAELSIMIQASFDLAIPHVQKVTRRFLVRVRLDNIRQYALDFARFSAAIEIQRIVRSKLACTEAKRLRKLRENFMITKIQSIVRRRSAILERARLYAIYMDKLRNRSATTIQCLYRGYACKLQAQFLAEERRRQLEEQEKARHASQEKDSATTIQKHCRTVLAKAKCANRRIEFGLHRRLLMYLERYVVDGCMWSFVKSINDDYIRYERTISHTIEREEKMAKTFVEKVINARDGGVKHAWENYIHFTHDSNSSTTKDGGMSDARIKKSSPKDKKELERRGSHCNTIKMIYGSSPQPRRIVSSRKSQTRKAKPNFDPFPFQDTNMEPFEANIPNHDNVSYQQEEKRLTSLNRIKDKLRGLYLRFDIPDGLDDTVSRFIMAVTLRYKFDIPGDSSVHGNFESAIAEKKHHQKCMAYAEPLIQRLHRNGIVLIRQLLENDMAHTLSSMGVTEEFLLLSSSLLNVLHQMQGGKYLDRKYLIAKCRHLLDAQNSKENGSRNDKSCTEQNNLASFLGECGAAASDDFDDDDNPGGIWMSKARCSTEIEEKSNHRLPTARQETFGSSAKNHTSPASSKTRRNKSWVIPYTAKIISENESKHPALKAYRQAQLLDRHNSNIKNN
ncbi:hypothetical protein ACHAXR_009742 [Thalassiosira sp. AJA248-18]